MSAASPSISLRDCLAKAKAGDQAARDRLFAACRSYLGLIARANVDGWMKAKVDASDLVQQTMLDAHRDFDRFQGRTDQEWLAWLRQILNHNACDVARRYGATGKRAVRREVAFVGTDDSQGAGIDPPSPIDSPSQLAIHNENELLLAEAMAELSEDYREVLVLRNIQRLPFEVVAERLGRTRPATQMLWMRAIQKLKTLLHVAQSGVSHC